MVIDGAGWYRSAQPKAPANIYLLTLPPYAPELDPIEHVWDELREKFLYKRAFDSLDALEAQWTLALKTLEVDPGTVKSIVTGPWLAGAALDSLMNEKWNPFKRMQQGTLDRRSRRQAARTSHQPAKRGTALSFAHAMPGGLSSRPPSCG